MFKIAILASGTGSNAIKIIKYFHEVNVACVTKVISNNPQAPVLAKAKACSIDCVVFPNNDWKESPVKILQFLRKADIDFIILAGFLRLIPNEIIMAYPRKILNIHPALLPKYGGKGMYGMHIHERVADNNETESGITIHLVNTVYDQGEIILQKKVALSKNDTAVDIQRKVMALEHFYYPPTIEAFIKQIPLQL